MPEGDGGSRIDSASIDAAIARVLQAERDARQAVMQHGRDAETCLERAKERAREIARRAAVRAVKVQRWSADELQRRLAELAAEHGQSEGNAAEAIASERLRRTAAQLAAELTEPGT